METLDYDYTVHTTPNAGDDTLYVKFFIDAVQDTTASQEAGRPIFKDVEWIDIRAPGSRDHMSRPVRPGDAERFPKHYAAFKARVGNEQKEIGTPLSTWAHAGMTRSLVEELKFFNIRTVEQLASVNDSAGGQLMGFHTLKTAAKAYMETAKVNAPLISLQLKLEDAMALIQKQAEDIAQLQGTPDEPRASPTGGRPKVKFAAAKKAPRKR